MSNGVLLVDKSVDYLKFEEIFDKYLTANSVRQIQNIFKLLCKNVNIDLNAYHNERAQTRTLLYQIIKSKYSYWKADDLWKTFNKRAQHRDYKRNLKHVSKDFKVLIIGCGPVGLRLSIECALLGIKCHIVEKRDRFSRNNVLHLWPYTIVDLKNLGAKKFYGQFCAGAIDHISIRKLQIILLKVALLMGVEVHFNVSFENLIEPTQTHGWKASFLPENHKLSELEYDVIVGADGRRNTLPGFRRKEFRGKLAIGITVNFLNTATQEEVEVQERSGVAFIFDQKFFLDLKKETGIDLENIVYYKDDTHYFVMTAKKQSLIEKGVILQDQSDPDSLLSKENVNFDKLCDYAKEAAYVSTERKLSKLIFAKNHYGQADVAMFDFTSLFQAENASRITERNGRRLLTTLIGDSLLEPFWPTGTGIARGFLATYDTAWQIRGFSMNKHPIDLLCERESIYQLLSQTTIDNLNKSLQDYSIDPSTRYSNLNRNYTDTQVRHLYDDGTTPIVEPIVHRANQDKFQYQTLLKWSQMVTQPYGIKIEDFTISWKNGLAFCAIVHRFHSNLIDYERLYTSDDLTRLSYVFKVLEKELQTKVDALPEEIASCEIPNKFTIIMIIDKIYGLFKYLPLNDVQLNLLESLTSLPYHRKQRDHDNEKKSKKIDIEKLTSIFKQQKSIEPPQVVPQPKPTDNKYSSYSTLCCVCDQKVYIVERLNVEGSFVHPNCFRCAYCSRSLKAALYAIIKDLNTNKDVFYCTNHVDMANTIQRAHNLVQRKRSFLNPNSDENNQVEDCIPPAKQKLQQDGGDSWRKAGLRNRFLLNSKTPERAEFEFSVDDTKSNELSIQKNPIDEDEDQIVNQNVSNEECESGDEVKDGMNDESEVEEVDDEEELDEEESFEEEEEEEEEKEEQIEDEKDDEEKPPEPTTKKLGTLLKLATDYCTWEETNKSSTRDDDLPPLPISSPPAIKRPSTVRIITTPKPVRDTFITCQKCLKITSQDFDLVNISDKVFHRECVKCYVCNTLVLAIEHHIFNDEEVKFYCERHWQDKLRVEQLIPVNESLLINEEFITKRKINRDLMVSKEDLEEDVCSSEKPTSSTLNVDLIRQKALEKAKMKTDEQLGVPKTPINLMNLISTSAYSSVSSSNSSSSASTSTQPISKDNNDFRQRADKIFEQAKRKTQKIIEEEHKAPLAESETFDSIDDIIPVRDTNVITNVNQDLTMCASTPITVPKFSNFSPTRTSKKSPQKSKSYKFIFGENEQTPSMSPSMATATSTIKNGILKILHPQKTSSSKSPTNSLDYKAHVESNDNHSFNTLNITHSPTLARSTRKYIRQHKSIERQRREKRLYKSQGILRELDVVLNSISELENDGVKIEQKICSMDDSQIEEKEKYEQHLYNLIHKKNILTRVEDELNIQVKALVIEDHIAECYLKMNETKDIPDGEKTKEIVEQEANLLKNLVQLVEEKNKLVEQLEQLRIRERQEDNSVNSILSEKGYNLDPVDDLIMKHNIFKDII